MIHRLLKIALLTGDGTCGALFGVWMLARARVEDVREDEQRAVEERSRR